MTATAEVAPATPRPAATRDGVVAMVPFVIGYAPFALSIGAAVAARGDRLAGWSGSWVVYGGSAHLATLQTLDSSGLLLAIVAGVVVNLRLVVYSASLARRWTAQPLWFRLLAAPLIIDPTWAVAEAAGDTASPAAHRRFFLAAGLTLGVGWSALIAAGAVLGARVHGDHLAVAVPLCLAVLVGPHLRRGDTRAVCAVAAAVAILGRHLPAGSGLVLAVLAGCAVGAVPGRSR
jgi:predicted branched-subunit amino acid permease